MADRATAKRARFALADLVNGKLQDVATFLAHLGEQPVPSVAAKKRDATKALQAEVDRLTRELATANAKLAEHPRVVTPAPERERRSFPKQLRRRVDRASIDAFKETHPACALLHCEETEPDAHHIIPRSHARSSDDERNLLNLGRRHHEEIEDLGAAAFRAKYISRLSEEDSLKLRLAVVMEANAKLADRDAVDRDEEHA